MTREEMEAKAIEQIEAITLKAQMEIEPWRKILIDLRNLAPADHIMVHLVTGELAGASYDRDGRFGG